MEQCRVRAEGESETSVNPCNALVTPLFYPCNTRPCARRVRFEGESETTVYLQVHFIKAGKSRNTSKHI